MADQRETYRQRAEECRVQSERLTNPVKISEDWVKLAHSLPEPASDPAETTGEPYERGS